MDESQARVYVAAPRKWLMDTGTPFDIVSINDVSPKAEEQKVPSDTLFSLNAVGGIQDVEWMLPMVIQMSGKWKEKCIPLLIEATSPAALCIGRRCMELEYAFHWAANRSCSTPVAALCH